MPPDSYSEIATGTDAEVLSAISRPGVSLALWHRSAPPALARWLDRLGHDDIPSAHVLVAPDRVRPALKATLSPGDDPVPLAMLLLIEDIVQLTGSYATIVGADLVDVRVERVSNDACWKFHRDHVRFRLISTYLGPGTEWVPDREERNALVNQRAYAGALARFPRFAVALFKGVDADNGRGVVHRSPPIAGTEVVRLVLCLNEKNDASPPPWTKIK